MLKTSDIERLFLTELNNFNIKDSGYDCVNGNKYIELRNLIFEVDKPYIFDIKVDKERMDDEWYVKYYEPRINHQFPGVINYLINNPNTRRAVLSLNQENEIYDPNGYVCTMYMHIFLDKVNDNEYDIEYSVHMRSNEVSDFMTDIKWHNKILNKIISLLQEKRNWKINKKNIIWFVDSFQVYEKNFEKIQCK